MWRWLVLALAALAILFGIEQWQGRRAEPPPTLTLTGAAPNYADTMARLDLAISDANARASAAGDQWLMHELVARNRFERARLSGSYDEYAAAAAALDRGFAVAAPRTGPHLVRAQLDYAMHRLAEAGRRLAQIDDYAIPPPADERAEMSAMRGDIAFYRGDLQGALRLYDEADRLAPGAATFRRAIYAARTGDMAAAERYFDRTEAEARLPTPQLRSYLELQRGILDLDRGRLDEAMVHFRTADRTFPGHWLIEEHIAEVLTLQGRPGEAEPLFRDIVRRTGHPEFIDALAGIAEQRGDRAGAGRLYAQADAAWRRRLQLFPEAAYGHAIDHCVAKGDWPCALALATRNHAARPYGDAKVALAAALLGNGRAEEAQRLIEAVLASPWRTADLHRTAADIYQARGLSAQAAEQDRLARAINPLA